MVTSMVESGALGVEVGWSMGGQLSQTAHGIPVPQVQPSGRRVLMGSGEGSGITGGTGSLSVCSGCRCGLQRLQGQGRSGGSSCTGDALSLAFGVGPTVSVRVSF